MYALSAAFEPAREDPRRFQVYRLNHGRRKTTTGEAWYGLGFGLVLGFQDNWTKHVCSIFSTRKTAPSPGDHVFQQTTAIYKLGRAIIRAHAKTEFHEDCNKSVTFGEITSNSAQNLSSNVHEDCTINVTFSVQTAPRPVGHVFQLFKLGRNKCSNQLHEDRAINVASRLLTKKILSVDVTHHSHDSHHMGD
ncbi:hypothetical protein DPMN_084077 [Dreissena polymorpha]|uniref:Uncharacterized protein n=1 Tax=Dreissena polymorpha TaxID=45954 RepID=A0A9D3YCH3_DREPO|nr:hypothetical protein DPMN_084077 [Dreissena polymorpha]